MHNSKELFSMFKCVDCGCDFVEKLSETRVKCEKCGRIFKKEDGSWNFLPCGEVPLRVSIEEKWLAHEDRGVSFRVANWLIPLIKRNFGEKKVTILSVGCGTGIDVQMLNNEGYDAYGIDIGTRASRWQRNPWREKILFARGEVLPFIDGVFDVVYSWGVIEHVGQKGARSVGDEYLKQRENFLTEQVRVLKKGGIGIVTCPNRWFPFDPFHARPGRPALNFPWNRFLLSVGDVKRLLRSRDDIAQWQVVSLKGYFIFERSFDTALKKLFKPVIKIYTEQLTGNPFFHRSFLNPHIAVLFRKK